MNKHRLTIKDHCLGCYESKDHLDKFYGRTEKTKRSQLFCKQCLKDKRAGKAADTIKSEIAGVVQELEQLDSALSEIIDKASALHSQIKDLPERVSGIGKRKSKRAVNP